MLIKEVYTKDTEYMFTGRSDAEKKKRDASRERNFGGFAPEVHFNSSACGCFCSLFQTGTAFGPESADARDCDRSWTSMHFDHCGSIGQDSTHQSINLSINPKPPTCRHRMLRGQSGGILHEQLCISDDGHGASVKIRKCRRRTALRKGRGIQG